MLLSRVISCHFLLAMKQGHNCKLNFYNMREIAVVFHEYSEIQDDHRSQ